MLRSLALAAGCLIAVPGVAAVTIIGQSSARMCFEAAESPMRPSPHTLDYCDSAFAEGTMDRHDTVATHVNRGILRMRRDDIAAGVIDFDAAIALDPDQAEAYLNKGAAFIRLADHRGALALFNDAIERNTRRPAIAYYGRGIANEELGNAAAAFRDYRRAAELDPDWAQPRADLRRFRVRGRG